MNEPTTHRRRWFQFGIGAALCAMIFVALLFAWLRSQLDVVYRRREWIEAHAKVAWRDRRAGPADIPFARRVLGDSDVPAMTIEGTWTHDEIKTAISLFPETQFVQTVNDPQTGIPFQVSYGADRSSR